MPASNLFWIALVVVNLLVQVLCFFRDESRPLLWARKITTPLLLFGAFGILWLESGTASSVAAILLLAMGIGELGIEGSSVVTSGNEEPSALDRWSVALAGLLFLAVNVLLGGVLLARIAAAVPIAIGFGVATAGVATLLALVLRTRTPEATVRTRMLLYSPGLVVLAAGAVAALFGPVSHLGVAALILTASDSLVLVRMGADLDKAIPSERTLLLATTLSILLLYYLYMAVLISTGSPFSS